MEEAQEFLDTWINDTRNESIKSEYKEYSEREVVEMLKEYKDKFSLSDVGKSFFCRDAGNTLCPYERQGGFCANPVSGCRSRYAK